MKRGRFVLGVTFGVLFFLHVPNGFPGNAASAEEIAGRIPDGLIVSYTFTEGSGSTVYDESTSGQPMDLVISGSAQWNSGENGLVMSGGRVGTTGHATKVIDALKASNQSTFEIWFRPANLTQGGPARLISIANGADRQNFMLGQSGQNVQARLLHTGKDGDARPRLMTSDNVLATNLTHLVHTYDGVTERLYVNGVQHPTTVLQSGVYSNWSASDKFSIGNEATSNRPWHGTVYVVAVYDRALGQSEIAQNFEAGAIMIPNSPPVAADDFYRIGEGEALTVDAATGVLANDSDSDGDPLTANLLMGPSDGILDFWSDGSFSYIPDPVFTGIDTFTYQAQDSFGGADDATVTVTVGNITNNPPVARNDVYPVQQGTTLTVDASTGVLANDSDPDGDTLTANLLVGPAGGILDFWSDGSFSYTPDPLFTGTDIFTYQTQDGFGGVDNATVDLLVDAGSSGGSGFYFPPPGEGLDVQDLRAPEEVGLDANIINALSSQGDRWALWRHGHLVHVKGDFNATGEVKSFRKTIHALTVGAAVRQGKIPSYDQQLSVWQTELTGNDATATWRHVLTQSAGFDYPGCNDPTDYAPGDIWTYSDVHLYHLCHALSKAYGKTSYFDNYDDVVQEAFFGAIGLTGWSTTERSDGIRFVFDLEDMGRLGLLILARGKWNGTELIPQQFIEELERKQTYGMQVNYNGCHDGDVCLTPDVFPEVPYGYLTWVNTDGDYFPGADTGWAWAWGAGGYMLMWNYNNGIVFAVSGAHDRNFCPPVYDTIPHIIDAHVSGPNPLENNPPAEGYIIDNGGPGTSSTGEWKVSGGANPYGVDSVYSKEAGDTYTFEAHAGGTLGVFLWWTEHSTRCAGVPVEISNAKGVLDVLSVNQQADESQWNSLGSYTFEQWARVTIFSPGGCSANADAVRFASSQPSPLPIAEFSAEPTDCMAPCNVEFTDLSNGEITAWEWDFDNDTVIDSNIQHPAHVYDAPGVYAVALSVAGPDGSDRITKRDYVTVRDPHAPPPEEYIIDNGGPGTSSTGEWKASGGANPYGVDSVYSKEAGDTYTFEADVEGALDVFLWWTEHSTRCASVRVEISDVNGVLDVLSVNQQTDESQWNSLGSYTFEQSARVTIFSPGGCSANADAVRFNSW